MAHIAQRGIVAKSGLMVGLGETEEEVLETMDDLLKAGCSILTIGQYLQPSRKNIPVAEYVDPEQFARYKALGLKRGFRQVESAPLVRSSYHVTGSFTELTGITDEDIESHRRDIFSYLLHPKERSAVIRAHTKTVLFYTKLYQKENHQPYVAAHYHFKIRKKDGSYKPVCTLIHPIFFSEAGYPLLGYVLFLPACSSGFEKFSIAIKDNDKKLYFSLLANKYVQRKNLELKDVEIDILKLTAKGHDKTTEECPEVQYVAYLPALG